jgi:hypothetical protein
MPLGTVVRDVYQNDERLMMYESLELLTRGNDWSRSGVYCFWDPRKCEALYMGLASVLPARFGQHNSQRGTRPRKGNKGREIDAWFGEHDRLGFSIILQEALADEEYEPYARNAEGQLLEGYRKPLASIDGASPDHIASAIDRAIEWRAGPPLYDTGLAGRLREYFS